jgi:uncharacterized protein GlcG (DUF336 family)
MKLRSLAAFTVATGLLIAGAAHSQQPPAPSPLDVVPDKMPFNIPYGQPISAERAQAVLQAAVAEAKKHDWAMNVAVVDPSGDLIAFERMDGAQLASIAISQHKARAAARFRRETVVFENAVVKSGYNYILSLDEAIASRGGVPLIVDGKLVGAVGCSGGTGSQDEVTCKAAAATINK